MKDLKQTDDMDLYLDDSGDIVWLEAALIPGTGLLGRGCADQHQKDMILAHKGEYRLTPTVGVGASDYLDDEGPLNLKREINKQFVQDAMKVKSIDAALNIVAGY